MEQPDSSCSFWCSDRGRCIIDNWRVGYFILAAVAERGVRKWKQLRQGVSHLQDTAKFILRKAQELSLLPALLQMMVDTQQPIKECSIALVEQCEKYNSVTQ